MTVPICAGSEQLGTLVASGSRQFRADEDALLRAVASQVAVALKRTELLERLDAGEPPNPGLRRAFESRRSAREESRARGWGRPRWSLHGGRRRTPVQRTSAPGSMCVATSRSVCDANCRARSVTRQISASVRWCRCLRDPGGCRLHVLPAIAKQFGVSIGSSEPAIGPASGAAASRQAADAQRIAAALLPDGGGPCEHLGAYKFLVHISPNDTPADRLLVCTRANRGLRRTGGTQRFSRPSRRTFIMGARSRRQPESFCFIRTPCGNVLHELTDRRDRSRERGCTGTRTCRQATQASRKRTEAEVGHVMVTNLDEVQTAAPRLRIADRRSGPPDPLVRATSRRDLTRWTSSD